MRKPAADRVANPLGEESIEQVAVGGAGRKVRRATNGEMESNEQIMEIKTQATEWMTLPVAA